MRAGIAVIWTVLQVMQGLTQHCPEGGGIHRCSSVWVRSAGYCLFSPCERETFSSGGFSWNFLYYVKFQKKFHGLRLRGEKKTPGCSKEALGRGVMGQALWKGTTDEGAI